MDGFRGSFIAQIQGLLHPAGPKCFIYRLVGTRGFAALSRPGPPVVFILLTRCFVGFPLQHTRPGPPAVFIPVTCYFVALSPSPTPCLHLWYTGRPLLYWPLPPPPPHSWPSWAGPPGNTKPPSQALSQTDWSKSKIPVTDSLMSVRGDGGSSERVSLRHHDLHLALEHFRPGAAHFRTLFLSATSN
jgi:hypothetical protein